MPIIDLIAIARGCEVYNPGGATPKELRRDAVTVLNSAERLLHAHMADALTRLRGQDIIAACDLIAVAVMLLRAADSLSWTPPDGR